jgi:transcriptional regulator NrdR family protein
LVIKSDGEKEFYDREKLEESILKAINKLDIPVDKIESMLADLEMEWIKNKK